MSTKVTLALLVVILSGVTARLKAQDLCAGGAPNAPAVYIDSSANDVTILTTDGRRLRASRDLLLCPGDEVRTGVTGRVAIRFEEKRTVIRLDGNSRTRVLSGGTGSADVNLLSGILYFISSVRRHFEVETPYIVAGIEGTEALVGVRPSQALALAAVRDGLVSAYDKQYGPDTVLSVRAGEAAYRSAKVRFQSGPIDSLPPPFRHLLIVSDSAVDWAVYYPPIMFVRDARNKAVREAIILLSSGDYDRAEAALATSAAAPAATASLRTIIATARNRLEDAERWSAFALKSDAQFAPAHVAASYVRQAKGDLEGALKFAVAAAEIDPDDAYVVARLAELHMTIGNRRAALEDAERSLANRRTPLALFVAGLARLAAWEYRRAEAYFEEAIQLDPEAPLPRLGLGLSYIRQGRTAAGAWEIERAVAHDPRRASIRTWLGRAYFDEGLTKKAAEQFRVSKQEDPNDPTPYLFSALERYAANDPIRALHELEEAQKRGEARRVIRSQRGLMEDIATRGAALGRIFDVLGFDQLAITEGTEAVDADQANPAAHRFLAEVYRIRPLQDIAQSSELLRSQLLSPPSKAPVQPELAEARLALLDTTGQTRVTFAEFSPLFDADGLRIDASGLKGTQQTWGGTGSVTGLYRGASISVGQFHYETDGYRENNDLQHDIVNGIATFAFSPEFSIFTEYRRRESEGGDRRLDFEIDASDAFDPTFRSQVTHEIARIGFHAQPSNKSDLLGVYTKASLSTDDMATLSFLGIPLGDIATKGRDEADSSQLQYMHSGRRLKTVVGGAYINNDVSLDIIDETCPVFPPCTSTTKSKTDYINAYMYSYIDFPTNVTWILGGSLIDYDDSAGAQDTTLFNPKIGVVANLAQRVRFRAAYLRNVKPDLVADQVIEPTNVAGFNQFYDAFNGSVLEQVGSGIDLRLGVRSRVGAEAIRRRWDVPAGGGPDAETTERVYRGYAYFTLSDRFSLAAEIVRERSESNASFDFAHWRTTSAPVRLNYFGKSGVFGSVGLEWVDHAVSDPGVSGEDTFTLVNAAAGYRIPRSTGIFSIEVHNLFDKTFNFQNRSIRTDLTAKPRYAPERTILARGTVKF